LDVMRRHVFNVSKRLPCAVDTLCLESINWLVAIEVSHERSINEYVCATGMNTEERWLTAVWLNGNQRRPRWRTIALENRCELRDRRRLEQRSERKPCSKPVLDLCE